MSFVPILASIRDKIRCWVLFVSLRLLCFELLPHSKGRQRGRLSTLGGKYNWAQVRNYSKNPQNWARAHTHAASDLVWRPGSRRVIVGLFFLFLNYPFGLWLLALFPGSISRPVSSQLSELTAAWSQKGAVSRWRLNTKHRMHSHFSTLLQNHPFTNYTPLFNWRRSETLWRGVQYFWTSLCVRRETSSQSSCLIQCHL